MIPTSADLGASLLRTLVPFIVGVAGSYGTVYLHLTTDQESTLVTAAVGFGYYTIVRLLEHRWPALGVLLGSPRAPVYPKGLDATIQTAVEAAASAAVQAYLANRMPSLAGRPPAPSLPADPAATVDAYGAPTHRVEVGPDGSVTTTPIVSAGPSWADLAQLTTEHGAPPQPH